MSTPKTDGSPAPTWGRLLPVAWVVGSLVAHGTMLGVAVTASPTQSTAPLPMFVTMEIEGDSLETLVEEPLDEEIEEPVAEETPADDVPAEPEQLAAVTPERPGFDPRPSADSVLLAEGESDNTVAVRAPGVDVCDPIENPTACLPPERDSNPPARDPSEVWAAINPGAVGSSLADSLIPDPRSSARGDAINRALQDDLRRRAMSKNYLSRRPPPELDRRADGSYVYQGTPFDATIHPDGRVSFEDHRVGPAPGQPIGTFTLDVTEEMMRGAGNDPYRHERAWFMRETREIRERLENESDRRNLNRAIGGLGSRLAQIWSSDAPARTRRRQLFELWDDCATDEAGNRARRVVEAFISRELPRGSPDAYPASELASLNARRQSPVPFAPYG
ncbi:MAG: hypothetical protein AAGF12_02145 [Myxococcota bacterium]